MNSKYIIGSLLLFPVLNLIVKAIVLFFFWNWFIYDLFENVKELNYAESMGITMLVMWFKGEALKKIETDKTISEADIKKNTKENWINLILYPIALLFYGFVIKIIFL